MDLKDNAWTRSIQKKFNVVRHEVDEFVGMGTMKYVENQVQTLGGTVKGFCSNVFQDFLPPALSNPVNHDAGTVPQEGKFVAETYKNSVSNLKENYADTDMKSLPSSNPVNLDAELVPQKEKHTTQNYDKPLVIIKEKCADIASKRLSTKQDSVHHEPPLYRLDNVNKTMPMPTKGDNQITKALFPFVKDGSALVNDNVKTSAGSVVSDRERLVAKERSVSKDSNSYFERLVARERSLSEDLRTDFEGLSAKEKSLSEDLSSYFEECFCKEKPLSEDPNSIGIRDETPLVYLTEDDYYSIEITDKAVSAAVDDREKVCSSVKERTCDTFFDDRHCNILGTPRSSEMECSFSSGCQVVEQALFSSTSSLSNDSYYRSEFCIIPHETENCSYDRTDSVSSISETQGHTDKQKIDISDNVKTIDLSEKRKLNDDCVIVDDKFPGATYCRPRRHRSYKQMIKDAYTKSKRLAKEYELLGIMYEDVDKDMDKDPVQHDKHSRLPATHEKTPGTGHSSTEAVGDCDWEFL